MYKSKLSKFFSPKILSIFLFLLLLGAYTNIFAVGIYAPGEILDPLCAPGTVDCTVAGGSQWTTTGSDIYYSTGKLGLGTATPNQQLEITQNFRVPNTTFASQYGIIYKDATPFIHNFNYGYNGVATTDGFNTFVGESAGNLTMGSTAGSAWLSSYNTGVGKFSLSVNTTGYSNTAIGSRSLIANTTGNNNTASGTNALFSNSDGLANTATGSFALYTNISGGYNVANGGQSLYYSTGSFNTAVGYNALYTNSTGASNVALGYNAGRYETGSNAFYVDNQNRTNTAGDKAGALLYGTFNATPASQTLTTNSAFTATYGMNIPTGQTYKINGVPLSASPITVVNTSNLFSTGLSGAGSGVTTSTYSNFFGVNAGSSATGAFNSNFFGQNAGSTATNAYYSNFLGYYAGNGSTNGNNSNFLGYYAGNGATSAYNSNFFGENSGYNASSAGRSNFFGQYAGQTATNASQSNFFGNRAGDGATNASYSNFLGYYSGGGATGANNSNFIGQSAGYLANSAPYSNFLGYYAGYAAGSASYSNLFGFRVGYNPAVDFIGSNNIIIGTNISLPNATANAINLGAVLFGTGTYSTITGDPSITPVAGGKIGIGVVSPSNTLHVTAAPTAGTHTARIANTLSGVTQNNGLLVLAGNNTGVAASEMITFQRTDATVIGSISQNAATTVAYNTSSDRRIKQIIGEEGNTKYGLSDLLNIKVSDFTFINDENQKPMTGFIAQDLINIFPDAVTTNGDDGLASLSPTQTPWMVDYGRLTPLIVKAIQEMDVRVKGVEELVRSDSSVKDLIKNFFASVDNGIQKIFVKEICISESECLNENDIRNLKKLLDEKFPTVVPEPVPEPAPVAEPLTCELPKVLNIAGDACVDKVVAPLVCEVPQVLNESGDACVDVEPAV